MTTFEITFNEKSTIGKYLLLFLEQNKKTIKVKDPTKLSKEEFLANIDEALEQYNRGEYSHFNAEEFKNKYGLK